MDPAILLFIFETKSNLLMTDHILDKINTETLHILDRSRSIKEIRIFTDIINRVLESEL